MCQYNVLIINAFCVFLFNFVLFFVQHKNGGFGLGKYYYLVLIVYLVFGLGVTSPHTIYMIIIFKLIN